MVLQEEKETCLPTVLGQFGFVPTPVAGRSKGGRRERLDEK